MGKGIIMHKAPALALQLSNQTPGWIFPREMSLALKQTQLLMPSQPTSLLFDFSPCMWHANQMQVLFPLILIFIENTIPICLPMVPTLKNQTPISFASGSCDSS